jgi:DNA invertase Pin-like site-specific DNA recombinase
MRRTKRFVGYFRASTQRQGHSGLGLDAQRAAVDAHLHSVGGTLCESFTEIESGKNSERPEMAKAIAACRLHGATLLIAKLDRLARNVHFVTTLMKDGLDFVAADMPNANKLTIHIMASFAEHERELISERTKAALAQAKARGVKLGNPKGWAHLRPEARSTVAAIEQVKRNADTFAARVGQMVGPMQAGGQSLRQIAAELTAREVQTPRGGQWTAAAVRNLLARIAPSSAP